MSLFFKKLYGRIWLAVVLAVAVLTFLVGLAWLGDWRPIRPCGMLLCATKQGKPLAADGRACCARQTRVRMPPTHRLTDP